MHSRREIAQQKSQWRLASWPYSSLSKHWTHGHLHTLWRDSKRWLLRLWVCWRCSARRVVHITYRNAVAIREELDSKEAEQMDQHVKPTAIAQHTWAIMCDGRKFFLQLMREEDARRGTASCFAKYRASTCCYHI